MSDQTILNQWEITARQLTDIVAENPSLRGMMLGYIAEYKLRVLWFEGRPHVSHYTKHDDHDRKKKGDLVITYHGKEFVVESKSLQTNSIHQEGDIYRGKCQCDASDRRPITFPDGSSIETTLLLKGEFDILAVNLFAFEEKWRFIFAKNVDLPRSTWRKYSPNQQAALLASLIPVSWPPTPPFRDEPFSLLDELLEAH